MIFALDKPTQQLLRQRTQSGTFVRIEQIEHFGDAVQSRRPNVRAGSSAGFSQDERDGTTIAIRDFTNYRAIRHQAIDQTHRTWMRQTKRAP